MASCAYAIVEFIPSSGVAIVPVTWLNVEEDKCFWPPKRSSAFAKVSSLVKKLEMPVNLWDQFNVKVLGKASMYASLLSLCCLVGLGVVFLPYILCQIDMLIVETHSTSLLAILVYFCLV